MCVSKYPQIKLDENNHAKNITVTLLYNSHSGNVSLPSIRELAALNRSLNNQLRLSKTNQPRDCLILVFIGRKVRDEKPKA